MSDAPDCPVCKVQLANGFHPVLENMRGHIKKDLDTGEVTHEPEVERGK